MRWAVLGTALGGLLGFEVMGSGLSAHLRHAYTGKAAVGSMMWPGSTGRKA